MSCRPVLRTVGVAAFTLLLSTALAASPAAASPTAPLLAAPHDDLDPPDDDAERLRAELGGSYGGAWKENGTLVVGTTDAAAAERVRAAGAQPRTVAHSSGELEGVIAKLDSAAPTAAPAVGSWYVDVAGNSVVVASTDMAAAQSFVSTAGAQADPVRIEMVRESPRPFADLVGGEAILAQAGGRCSIGFSARSATDTFVITAGHCTEVSGNWSGADGTVIGPVAATDFPVDDFGAIQVTNTAAWTPTNEVAGAGPVTGSTPAVVGDTVCRSGSSTGLRCGTILSRNATVNYGGGAIVRGLTRTDACAEPGDSGGSFVAGSQAQGLTSGGSGNCSTGGETFFQPIGEVLDRYGVSLVTS